MKARLIIDHEMTASPDAACDVAEQVLNHHRSPSKPFGTVVDTHGGGGCIEMQGAVIPSAGLNDD
jgi:hypothetical protein